MFVLFCSVRCGLGPCRAWLPYFGCWAAAALWGAAGWVPSGGFAGWCLALATAESGFRLMGSLDGAFRAVFCGLVVALWLGAALLCMIFVVTQCSVVFFCKAWCSVMLLVDLGIIVEIHCKSHS